MEGGPAVTAAALTERLVGWLQEQARAAGARGAVVGLSGGIDSAVVAGLLVRAFPGASLGLIMPCHSDPEHAAHAQQVAAAFGLPCRTVNLSAAYDLLTAAYSQDGAGTPERKLALANLKPRLRMATLYFHANLHSYLVVGTGNRAELYVGYFTKYGDGGVDLLPLGELTKGQVRDLARYLGVPQPVIDKPPSAGLWEGQTDEGEMGLSYADLDRYLLTGAAEPSVRGRVEAMHRKSEHKRRLPPVAPA